MISIEITESPDANVRAPYTFNMNDVYLGHQRGNLLITDPGLLASHLMIEVVNNELIVHPQRGVEFFLLNGKRATAIRKLKRGDQVTIGGTTLKIVDFAATPDLTKKTFLNEKLAKLINENDIRLGVIEKLGNLMK